jgi:tripartite-type tricarboxylate transporter receptor subunit TctC
MTRTAAVLREALQCTFAALLLAASTVGAQTYPVKPIRLVIPYPPGGVDITIRHLLPYMDQDLGQPSVIDYRAGAGGMIGTEYVSRAEPDGYTLLATASNPWVVTPAMRKQTPYHPIESFTPITSVSQGGVNLIVANLDFPPTNLTELFAYAKKFPDKVAWATSGLGSAWHLDAEHMNLLAGTKILHAPFNGFGPMIPAVVSGQVQMALIPYQYIQPMLTSKKVKILGLISTEEKALALAPPGLERMKNLYPDYVQSPSWIGIGGPARLPRPIVMRINQAVNKAIAEPKVQEAFAPQRTIIAGSTPEEFAERIRRDYELSVKIVRAAGIPLE